MKENGSNSSASETYPVAHAISTPPPSRPKVTIFRGSIADITDVGDVLISTTSVAGHCERSADNGLPVTADQRPRASPNAYGWC